MAKKTIKTRKIKFGDGETYPTESVVSDLANPTDIELNEVAKSGSYNDLVDKPKLNTSNTSAQTVKSNEEISGTINLHKVSKTGDYGDLNNKPVLNTTNTTPLSTSSNETIEGTINLHKVSKTGLYTHNVLVSKKLVMESSTLSTSSVREVLSLSIVFRSNSTSVGQITVNGQAVSGLSRTVTMANPWTLSQSELNILNSALVNSVNSGSLKATVHITWSGGDTTTPAYTATMSYYSYIYASASYNSSEVLNFDNFFITLVTDSSTKITSLAGLKSTLLNLGIVNKPVSDLFVSSDGSKLFVRLIYRSSTNAEYRYYPVNETDLYVFDTVNC